jgi:GntR family transcriptional regulator
VSAAHALATTARRLDRSSGVPLWRQLRDDLALRLAAGEFPGAFPGELALRDEYGVSRHTVREALRQLRQAGMVTAGRGRSPRVAGPAAIEQPIGALYSVFAAVEATGVAQVSVVRALDVRTDAVVADRLALPESAPLVYLERLRLAGPEPLALDRVWLPADLAAPLLEADFTHTSLYGELAERCGVRLTDGTERLRAVVPTAGQRGLLAIDDSTAAFAIDRVGVANGVPVEWRQSLVRGDRFAMSAEFSARGYRVDLASGGDQP